MSTGGTGGVAAEITLDDSQVQAGVARLQAAMDAAGASMKKLQADFAGGRINIDKFTEGLAALNSKMGQIRSSSESFGVSVSATGQRTQAAVRGITDFSRAAEDFSTGGFLGVMNNVPGMMTNVGSAMNVGADRMALFTAGASILLAVGYTLYKNWDSVVTLFRDSNPFPKTTDTIEDLTEAIKTNEKELDNLRDKQGLSNREVERANKLLAENIRLEKEKKEAQKIERVVQEIEESKRPEDKERATAFKEAVGGEGKEVRKALTAEFQKDADAAKAKQLEDIQPFLDDLESRIKDAEAKGDTEKAVNLRVAANQALSDARKGVGIATGQKRADQFLMDLTEGKPEAFERLSKIPGLPKGFRERAIEESPAALAEYDRETAREQGEHADWRRSPSSGRMREAAEKRSERVEQAGLKEEREAVETAKENLPGIEQVTEQAFLEVRAGGMNTEKAKEEVQRRLKRELMATGMDEEGATRAARGLAGGAAQKVQEQVVRTRLGLRNKTGEDEPPEVKASQVFAGSELMNRIQSGTTNETAQHNRKMETWTEQMYEALAKQIVPAIKGVKGVNAKVTR